MKNIGSAALLLTLFTFHILSCTALESEARTPLEDFFSILPSNCIMICDITQYLQPLPER
jgi:hypothetical protein